MYQDHHKQGLEDGRQGKPSNARLILNDAARQAYANGYSLGRYIIANDTLAYKEAHK